MNEKQFDDVFEQTLESAVEEALERGMDDIEQTQADTSWLHIQKELKKKRTRQSWKRQFPLLSVAAASLIVGAMIFSPSFFERGTTDFSGSESGSPPDYAGDYPVDDYGDESLSDGISIRETVTFEEAKERTSFYLYEPGYLPDGYQLYYVAIFFQMNEDKAGSADLEYIHTDGSMMTISQTELPPNSSMSSGVNESVGTVEEVMINGNKGFLVITDEGNVNKIEWLQSNVILSIVGDLPGEELIKIAESMN